MSEESLLDQTQEAQRKPPHESWIVSVWEAITQAGLAELVFRLGTHALLVALILLVAWGLRQLYLFAQATEAQSEAMLTSSLATPAPQRAAAGLPAFGNTAANLSSIPRLADLHTEARSQPRTEVITYTVQTGDTLFGVAEKYGLKPETILWSNQSALGDNPHNLRPGQVLNILPVDGTYHRWSAGDGLNGVAEFFNVTPQDIIDFTGNHLNPEAIENLSNPNIAPGTWLVIPGGRREYVNWSAPVIPLDNPGAAKILGPGACDTVAQGAVGAGVFIWPVNNHFLSGYSFDPGANHPAIDIDGNEGDPVYAVDNGIIVYAGWNDWGYGYMIVINHGNGWQTLYAHLSAYYVNCGASVWQGNAIGAVGATGNASGSHLHFEMMYNGVKVNPLDYLR